MNESLADVAPIDALAATLLDESQAASWPAAFAALQQRVAATGDAADQELLGRVFHLGRGTAADREAAIRHYRMAADQGRALAQYLLGLTLSYWSNPSPDEDEAVRYLQMASTQGFAAAQYQLCLRRNYVWDTRDQTEIARHWQQAAQRGEARAQDAFARCLAQGLGVEKDEVEAVRYYRMAADQGHPGAQIRLGQCLAQGVGLEKNEAEARRYARLAAAPDWAWDAGGGPHKYLILTFETDLADLTPLLAPFLPEEYFAIGSTWTHKQYHEWSFSEIDIRGNEVIITRGYGFGTEWDVLFLRACLGTDLEMSSWRVTYGGDGWPGGTNGQGTDRASFEAYLRARDEVAAILPG